MDAQTIEPFADDVETFCRNHGISRYLLYRLWKDGRGPDRMKVGGRVLISRRAGAAWRERMERESTGSNEGSER